MNSTATFTIVSISTRALIAAGSALIALVLFAAVLTIADSHELPFDLALATASLARAS
jgi:hypothetical protein